jgi:hypothetical protein
MIERVFNEMPITICTDLQSLPNSIRNVETIEIKAMGDEEFLWIVLKCKKITKTKQ